jgi:RNA polymerase sigma-70 factor (ECF subfamily)
MSSFFSATRFPALALSKDKAANALVAEDKAVASVEVSDESLIARICLDDKEALALLFRRYARLVRSIARKILRDDAEAEDIVQEVFLYVYRKCALYDSSRGSARSWLGHTSYYLALHQRMHLAARHHYGSLEVEGSGAEELAGPSLAEYDRSGEGLFGRARWREILGTLTTDQWDTLRLHFFEGFTLVEISEKRGVPLGNVRHHYYRGLDQLRRQMLAKDHSE